MGNEQFKMIDESGPNECLKPCMYCGTPNWIGAKVCVKCQKNISLGGFTEFRIEQKFRLFLEIQRRNGMPKELKQKILEEFEPACQEGACQEEE